MNIYKFSSSATSEAPDITEDRLIEQMKSGDRYRFGTSNLVYSGVFKLNGWVFVPDLNKYVYKQYGSWSEAYAPSKTILRKLIYGHIDQIVEA